MTIRMARVKNNPTSRRRTFLMVRIVGRDKEFGCLLKLFSA